MAAPAMEEGAGIALYIHIPFCRAKCSYCDFVSYPGLDGLHDQYITAIVQEMDLAGPFSICTTYIGGGTPTVLPLSHLARILAAIEHTFDTRATAEITIEANPATVTPDKLSGLRALGISRVSLGVQSFVDSELRLLGRIHSADEAGDAFQASRQAGFDNVSMDLLYGLPGQTIASWQKTLERALALHPDHLSLYALTVEQGTPLAAAIARGEIRCPDPDLAADMYELARDKLEDLGFLHYEISNWARSPDHMCQHNLIYWHNEPYLGLGAAAHSWLGGQRWANVPEVQPYLEELRNGRQPVAGKEILGRETEMGDTMILGLRLLREGVDLAKFRERFGLDLRIHFANELEELTQLGLIEINDERVTLSKRGQLLGNQVFLRFVEG